MNSFLRWAGSKKQLLPKLSSFWDPSYRRYVEPFAGSACLFFSLEPEEAVLGDLNQELITTLRMVKLQPDLVIEALKRLRKGRTSYYKIRNQDQTMMTEVERAAIFIYLNKFCFNGLYRTNRAGKFNVPFGDTKGSNEFDFTRLLDASVLLQRAQLQCTDFQVTLQNARKGDFIYMDPPYFATQRRIFSEYQAQPFRVGDLERLTIELTRLDTKGIPFVVSYADCKEGREVLEPWLPKRISTRRNIAGFASNRRFAKELLATNIS